MVKYYNVEGALIKLINDTPVVLKRNYISYNNIIIITEDGIIDGKEVHEGDIVITFYHTNDVAIIRKNTDLAEILISEIQNNNKRKEISCCEQKCCDCDSCSA